MKNLWIALLLVLLITSCLPGKIGKKDPEPDLAGTYQMTSFVNDGITIIPLPGVSGQVNVVKNNDTQLSVSFLVTNANTGKTVNSQAALVTIRKASGSTYDLLANGNRVGSIDGTSLSLSESDNSGSYSIVAKK